MILLSFNSNYSRIIYSNAYLLYDRTHEYVNTLSVWVRTQDESYFLYLNSIYNDKTIFYNEIKLWGNIGVDINTILIIIFFIYILFNKYISIQK